MPICAMGNTVNPLDRFHLHCRGGNFSLRGLIGCFQTGCCALCGLIWIEGQINFNMNTLIRGRDQ